MHAYTVAQIRAAEDLALQVQGDRPLMVRAATALAVTIARRLPFPLPGRRVVLLVGGGNNGGDALFAGANLARRGVGVTAVLADPDRIHADGLAALRRAGGRVTGADRDIGPLLGAADVLVDGLVGIGARPPLREVPGRLVQLANAAPGFRVAVDVPSGLDPDSGRTDGPVFDADLTVTFGGAKTGLLLSDHAGELLVESLDFPLPGGPFDVVALDDHDVAALLPAGAAGDDKYRNGVLGVVAGSADYPGAAVLCTGAAVRTRPGMVRFAGSARDAVVARWPEVVGADSVADTGRVQAWVGRSRHGHRRRRTGHAALGAGLRRPGPGRCGRSHAAVPAPGIPRAAVRARRPC